MPSRKRMRSLIDATINLPIQCSVVIHQKVFFFQAKYKHTLKTLRSLPRYIGVNSEVENTYTVLTVASLVLVLKKSASILILETFPHFQIYVLAKPCLL